MKIKITLALFLLSMMLSFSSCASIFSATKQKITFAGDSGIKIYDEGNLVTEIQDDGFGKARIRKRITAKTLVAKKEGYKTSYIQLEPTLNFVALLNLTDIIGWAIDVATGKVCNWKNTFIEVQLDQNNDNQ